MQQTHRGQKRYELSNHLGNVLAVITDRRIQRCNVAGLMYYDAQVVSVSDYYPFGSSIKARSWSDSTFSYRFGFNGMENDNEIKGEGNSYDFGARIYDSRLGKWLSVDPLRARFPEYSPYHYAYNSPLSFMDVGGEFPWPLFWKGVKGAVFGGSTEYVFSAVDNYFVQDMDFESAISSVDLSDIAHEAGVGAIDELKPKWLGGGKNIKRFKRMFTGNNRKFTMFVIKQSKQILESAAKEAIKTAMNLDDEEVEFSVDGILLDALGEQIAGEIINATLDKAVSKVMVNAKKTYRDAIDKVADASVKNESLIDKLENAGRKKRKKIKKKIKANKKIIKSNTKIAKKTLGKQYAETANSKLYGSLKSRAAAQTNKAISSKITELRDTGLSAGPLEQVGPAFISPEN